MKAENSRFISQFQDRYGEKYTVIRFAPSIKNPKPVAEIYNEYIGCKARSIFRMIFGYVVYFVLNERNDAVAYCVLKKRQSFRQPFMKKNDYLIAPYFVKEDYRNRGIARKMLETVLKISEYNEKNCCFFAAVKTENAASLKVLYGLGFENIGFIKNNIIQIQTIVKKENDVAVLKKQL